MAKENEKEKKIMGGYLASALDIEDHMSIEVYGDFLYRNAWPADLEENVFENIKQLLGVVIKETDMHKKTFLELQKKLNDN
jgi:hypothetical protein